MNHTKEMVKMSKITAYNNALIELYHEINETRESGKIEASYAPLIRALRRIETLKGEVQNEK